MTLVAFALLTMAQAQDAETTTYRDDILNVAFSHPKTWKVKKRDKRLTVFELPLAGSEDTATIEIIRSSFRSEPDIWQTIQLRTNELSKNTVIRQWEQTVLDAPLLLTQAETNLKGRRVTRLTGLYYTRTPLKMLFTMEVPTAKFEEAQYSFNQSLETLRTIDGSNFTAENPDAPSQPGKVTPVAPKRTVDDGKAPGSSVVKLKNQIESTAGSLKSIVKFRDGWTALATEKGIELSPTRGSLKLVAEIGTPLDTSPASVLKTKAGESLVAFIKVNRREDHDPSLNEAGATVTWVWRRGEGTDGPRQSLDAIIVTTDRFLWLTYVGTDAKRFDAEQAAINELLERITIEPSP